MCVYTCVHLRKTLIWRKNNFLFFYTRKKNVLHFIFLFFLTREQQRRWHVYITISDTHTTVFFRWIIVLFYLTRISLSPSAHSSFLMSFISYRAPIIPYVYRARFPSLSSMLTFLRNTSSMIFENKSYDEHTKMKKNIYTCANVPTVLLSAHELIVSIHIHMCTYVLTHIHARVNGIMTNRKCTFFCFLLVLYTNCD